MEIKDSLYTSILNIRYKRAHHKKLEKNEQEFYSENRDLINLKIKETAESREARHELMKLLGRE